MSHVCTRSWQKATCTRAAINQEHPPPCLPYIQLFHWGRGSPAGNIFSTDEAAVSVFSPGNLDFCIGTCVPQDRRASQVPRACVCVREHLSSRPMCMCARLCSCTPPLPLSAALMTLAQRKVMTNARYQRTRPMTNGRAPEQPHYAVITEDGWPGAPPTPTPCR